MSEYIRPKVLDQARTRYKTKSTVRDWLQQNLSFLLHVVTILAILSTRSTSRAGPSNYASSTRYLVRGSPCSRCSDTLTSPLIAFAYFQNMEWLCWPSERTYATPSRSPQNAVSSTPPCNFSIPTPRVSTEILEHATTQAFLNTTLHLKSSVTLRRSILAKRSRSVFAAF